MKMQPQFLCDFGNGTYVKCKESDFCKHSDVKWKYNYNLSPGSTSIPNWYEEMGLVCKSSGQKGLIGSINYVGFAICSLIGPRLSDHIGRKKVIIPGLILCILVEAFIIFLCRNFGFLITLFFFYGCTGTCRISLMYLFMQEMTPKKRQPLVGTIVHVVNGITSSMSIIYQRYIYYDWVPY